MTISATLNHTSANLAQIGPGRLSSTAGQLNPFFNQLNSFSPSGDQPSFIDRLGQDALADRTPRPDPFSEPGRPDQRDRKKSNHALDRREERGDVGERGGVGDLLARQEDHRVSPLQDRDRRSAGSQPHQTDPPVIDEAVGDKQERADGLAATQESGEVAEHQQVGGDSANLGLDQGEQVTATTLDLAGQDQNPEFIAQTIERTNEQSPIDQSQENDSQDQSSSQHLSSSEQPANPALVALQSQVDGGQPSGPTAATSQKEVASQMSSVVVPQGESSTSFTQGPDSSGSQIANPILSAANQEGDSFGGEAQTNSGGSQEIQTTSVKSPQQVGSGQLNFTSHLEVVSNLSTTQSVRSGQQAAAANDVAPAPAPYPESNEANIARVMRGMRGVINQNGGSVTLRLSPPEMGIVRVEMQINQGSVSAQLHTEQEGTRMLLAQQLGQLRQSLEAQGLHVDRLTVATMPSDSTNFTTDRDAEQSSADGRSRGHDLAGEHHGHAGGGQDGQEPESKRYDLEFEQVLNMVA